MGEKIGIKVFQTSTWLDCYTFSLPLSLGETHTPHTPRSQLTKQLSVTSKTAQPQKKTCNTITVIQSTDHSLTQSAHASTFPSTDHSLVHCSFPKQAITTRHNYVNLLSRRPVSNDAELHSTLQKKHRAPSMLEENSTVDAIQEWRQRRQVPIAVTTTARDYTRFRRWQVSRQPSGRCTNDVLTW